MTTARRDGHRRLAQPVKRRPSAIAARLGELADLYQLGRSLAQAHPLFGTQARKASRVPHRASKT
jgi:hypothetical protein